jgi:hypothetical protein
MTQQEIRKKFDQIIAFAEVEKFLDTLVKRRSSGMHIRLAFPVVAHLEARCWHALCERAVVSHQGRVDFDGFAASALRALYYFSEKSYITCYPRSKDQGCRGPRSAGPSYFVSVHQASYR